MIGEGSDTAVRSNSRLSDLRDTFDATALIIDDALTAVSMSEPAVKVALHAQVADHGIVGAEDRRAGEFVFADMTMRATGIHGRRIDIVKDVVSRSCHANLMHAACALLH